MYYIAKFKKKPRKDLLCACTQNSKLANFLKGGVGLERYLREKNTLKIIPKYSFCLCLPSLVLLYMKRNPFWLLFKYLFVLHSASPPFLSLVAKS